MWFGPMYDLCVVEAIRGRLEESAGLACFVQTRCHGIDQATVWHSMSSMHPSCTRPPDLHLLWRCSHSPALLHDVALDRHDGQSEATLVQPTTTARQPFMLTR